MGNVVPDNSSSFTLHSLPVSPPSAPPVSPSRSETSAAHAKKSPKPRSHSVRGNLPAARLSPMSLSRNVGEKEKGSGLRKSQRRQLLSPSGETDNGARFGYGLLMDKTKSKKKSGGRLTLFWNGEFPPDLAERLKPIGSKGKGSSSSTARNSLEADPLSSIDSSSTTVHLFDVSKVVNLFNSIRYTLPMSLTMDRTHVCGYVEVHLDLIHPISIIPSAKPPLKASIEHQLRPPPPGSPRATSKDSVIYLNDMTTKMLINSETTASEVIDGLMEKYGVADDKSNFGLFECDGVRGGPGGRRLQDDEEPLVLTMLWGPLPKHCLSLQLATTMKRQRLDTLIHWERFSYAELGNFLKMLNIEEQKYVDIIESNYKAKRARIVRLMESKSSDSGDGSTASAAEDG